MVQMESLEERGNQTVRPLSALEDLGGELESEFAQTIIAGVNAWRNSGHLNKNLGTWFLTLRLKLPHLEQRLTQLSFEL